MVQIAVNVILDHSIIINKQYYLCEKQLCTYSLLHFLLTLHHYDVKLPSLAFSGQRKRTTTRFSFCYLECGF